MAVLDSTFLIAIERGDARALARLAELQESAEPLRVPAAVWVEYLFPMAPPARTKAARLLEASTIFEPFERALADTAATLQNHLRALGTPLGWHDLQVAATALHYREALVSADAAFRDVPGIETMDH